MEKEIIVICDKCGEVVYEGEFIPCKHITMPKQIKPKVEKKVNPWKVVFILLAVQIVFNLVVLYVSFDKEVEIKEPVYSAVITYKKNGEKVTENRQYTQEDVNLKVIDLILLLERHPEIIKLKQ